MDWTWHKYAVMSMNISRCFPFIYLLFNQLCFFCCCYHLLYYIQLKNGFLQFRILWKPKLKNYVLIQIIFFSLLKQSSVLKSPCLWCLLLTIQKPQKMLALLRDTPLRLAAKTLNPQLRFHFWCKVSTQTWGPDKKLIVNAGQFMRELSCCALPSAHPVKNTKITIQKNWFMQKFYFFFFFICIYVTPLNIQT